MIVRNEGKIISRLLDSVLFLVDSYCICDTGSTDDTVEIIVTFFKSHNILGKIIREPFKDFGYNRTIALQKCVGMQNADYILLLDADMTFWMDEKMNVNEFKSSLTKDCYSLYQGSPTFFYKNRRLVKNIDGISYWGVTHEYLDIPENFESDIIEMDRIFIKDIGDGGSKIDKFDRDINLLKQGLVENPNNDRYTFYLANSYKDKGDYKNAITTYAKRIKLGGWIEEVWHSYYSMGKCYIDTNEPICAINSWMEGFQCFPQRVENLYEIIKYYRTNNKYILAYSFYLIAEQIMRNKKTYDNLFVQRDIYDYKLDYELSIIGYYANWENKNIINSCMKVLCEPSINETILTNVLSNYKYYTPKIIDKQLPMENIRFNTIGDTLSIDRSRFHSSTPSVIEFNGDIIVNVRFVNYTIDDKGNYQCEPTIETINVIAIFKKRFLDWTKHTEFIIGYDTQYDAKYVGLEDIRLFKYNDKLLYNTNRYMPSGNMMVETGEIDLYNSVTINSKQLKYKHQQKIEKNWVFCQSKGALKMVYKWHPLTVGDVIDNDFIKTHEIKTPTFFRYMRGSTNGIIIDDEIWFLTHIVSYESKRYYYHTFVILDATTMALKRYSPLFTFEKQAVEYTLGFIHYRFINVYNIIADRFLISYSLMDSETKYMMIDKSSIDELCKDYNCNLE